MGVAFSRISCRRSELPELPDDIITEEILIRLPAKSLLRCKLVCKEWHAIISSPSFIKRHFDHDSNLTRLLLYCRGFVFGNYRSEFRCSYFPDETQEVPDHLLLWGEIRQFRGPCNGFFCIYVQRNRFALWNPTTRRLRPVLCHPSLKFNEIGFGMDPLTGDLKIVLINTWPYISPCFAVYTSSNDSWKYLKQQSLLDSKTFTRSFLTGTNTFLNGFYYWLKINRYYESSDSKILAFDMHNERFEDIKMPAEIINPESAQLHLFSDDSLAVVSKFDDKRIEIWLMEGKGYWKKLFSVVLPFSFDLSYGFWGCSILICTRDDHRDSMVMMFDLDSHSVRKIKVGNIYSVIGFFPIFYKECLFTIKGERHGIQDYDIRSEESLEFLCYRCVEGNPVDLY